MYDAPVKPTELRSKTPKKFLRFMMNITGFRDSVFLYRQSNILKSREAGKKKVRYFMEESFARETGLQRWRESGMRGGVTTL
jgi:hypothetical protein